MQFKGARLFMLRLLMLRQVWSHPLRSLGLAHLHPHLSWGRGAIALLLGMLLSWGALLPVRPAAAEDYTRVSLLGADFSEQDLRDSEFTKANLRQSDFHGSNLRGVSFFAANLEEVNLAGADLRDATLDSARLVEADLTNALLEGAFATNAKFEGAIITGADFTDVLMRSDAQAKLCAIAAGTNPITGRDTRDTLYCD